jgi:RNA polymerase sigma-70 factor (ECF subfamily)
MLSELARHDPEAWKKLCRLYCPLVYHWCLKAGLQMEDAADVVQEVLMTVHSDLARYEHQSFRGWLWGITRNRMARVFRKRAIPQQGKGGSSEDFRMQQLPDAPSESDDPEELLRVQQQLLRNALTVVRPDFSEQTWQAFYGIAIEKKSVCDLCAELGMSSSAVKQAKYRVLQRLKEILETD